MVQKYLLVGNPTSQSGRARGRIAGALSAMKMRGWDVDFLETLPAGRTVDVLARRLAEDPPEVVVFLGGDGTFAEVAKALLKANMGATLAMLPAGTANDQGKSFGISSSVDALERNLDIIQAGYVRKIDVGVLQLLGDSGEVVDSEFVFHSVGWGMQPDMLAQRNRDRALVSELPVIREFYRDHAVYAGAVLSRTLASWVEPTKFDVIADCDGQRRLLTGVTDVVVNGTPVYGGVWVFDVDAEADDGKFEFLPVYGRRDFAVQAVQNLQPIVVMNERLGLVRPERGAFCRVSVLEIWMERPGKENVRSQVDGEEWHSGRHFQLRVHRALLPVIVPEGYCPPWRQEEHEQPL